MLLGFAFVVLFASWFLYVRATPIARPTFFSDPVHAVLILGAAAAAIAGGASGLIAFVTKRERSIGVFMSVIFGAVVLYWVILELGGH